MGVVAYTAVKYYGENYYREYIDSRYDLAIRFSELIKEVHDLELAMDPDANIVCFRFVQEGKTVSELNKINAASEIL